MTAPSTLPTDREIEFKGWAAFSVYGVEGEDGAIYLSAGGVKAKCSFTTPMGRALGQLAAIQAEAASPASLPTRTPEELESLLSLAVGALEPFAARCADAVYTGDSDTSGLTVKVGHLRRAVEVIAQIRGGRESMASSARNKPK